MEVRRLGGTGWKWGCGGEEVGRYRTVVGRWR